MSKESGSGFYKRRRGVVEHIEAGTINLLENGIHDYLNLKANLVIGNGRQLPAGVVSTSAPALRPYCGKGISERTIRRALNHLEEIGWIKFSPWRTNGKRGNYVVVICRASVHDLSGKEYRVNGEETTDWRNPVYECAEDCPQLVRKLSGLREVENREERKEEEKTPEKTKTVAAKPTRPADPRFQLFVDFAYGAFQAKYGAKPSWQGKDWKGLKTLLGAAASLDLDDLQARWQNYLGSTEAFTAKQGGSLAYFCEHVDSFLAGPILEKRSNHGKADPNQRTLENLRAAGFRPN